MQLPGIIPIIIVATIALLSTAFAREFSNDISLESYIDDRNSIFSVHKIDKMDRFSKKVMIAQETHLVDAQSRASEPRVRTNFVGAAPFKVTLDANTYSGCTKGCFWNFGDGDVATGPVVSHSFQYAGTYSVTLRSEQNNGLVYLKRFTVTVNDQEKKSQNDISSQDSPTGSSQKTDEAPPVSRKKPFTKLG